MNQRLCYIVYTMSSRVGIRELRQQASALLKRVAGGEGIEVTDHGHAIARIVPLRAAGLEQLMAEGAATAAHGNLIELSRELELPAAGQGTIAPSEALAELRRDER